MKKNIIQRLCLFLLLVSPFVSIGQGNLIKGLSGLPITSPDLTGNTLEVRFFVDRTYKIDYPNCYPKQDSIFTWADSTVWHSYYGEIKFFQKDPWLGKRSCINSTPYPTPVNYGGNNSIYCIPFELKNKFAGNVYADEYYEEVNQIYSEGNSFFFINNFGMHYSGFYAYKEVYNPLVDPRNTFCGDLIISTSFNNVIAQFRTKPTTQNPQGTLLPYYCNGGGSIPTIAGGYVNVGSGSGGGSGGGGSGSGGGSGGGGSGSSTIRNLCGCGTPAQTETWLTVPEYPSTCTNVPLQINGTTPVLFVDHPAGEVSEILKGNFTPGSKTNAEKEVSFGITDDPTPVTGDWTFEDNKPQVWKLEYEPLAGKGIFTLYNKCGDSLKVTKTGIVTRLRPNELEIKTSVQWSDLWPDSYAGMKLDLKVLSINKKKVKSNAFSSCSAKKGKHIWNKVTLVSNELNRDKVIVVGTFNVDLPSGVVVPLNQSNIRFQVETNYDPTVEGLAFPAN